MGISDIIKQNQDKGAMLARALTKLVELYPDRSHFIYELLQNAEDAGASTVKFFQFTDRLEVLHDGKPFTQSNLQSLCDVALSDKPINSIGKFGIGFKSVFTICNTVSLYSEPSNRPTEGTLQRFALKIENYTDPTDIADEWSLETPYTTKFVFPYESTRYYQSIEHLKDDIAKKLRKIGHSVLLFLSNIKEIKYIVLGASKGYNGQGLYKLERIRTNNGYYIAKPANESDKSSNAYLIFSKQINDNDTRTVDIAFSIGAETDMINFNLIKSSYISTYFPTEIESKLKFIVQAPFELTPERSVLLRDSECNQKLAELLAELLGEAAKKIKAENWVTLEFLNVLPFEVPELQPDEEWLFKPLYDATIEIFENDNIYPVIGGGYSNKEKVRIARGGVQEGGIIDIFTNKELGLLVGEGTKWLPTKTNEGNFTDDRNNIFGGLYRFIRDEIKIPEIRNTDIPELIRANPGFMVSIDDDTWLEAFYNHLSKKVESKLGKRQAFSTVDFIKTQQGDFVAAFKLIGQDRLPNIFKKPKETQQEVKDIFFVADFIQENCSDFLEQMDITEPDEYDYFIKVLENSSNNKSIDPKENIKQVKQAIQFLKADKANIIEICKTQLYLRVIDTNEKIYYIKSGNASIYQGKDYNGVSLYDYLASINCNFVYILDTNYYLENGLISSDLILLEKIGLKSSVYENMNEDYWYDGNTRCDNIGKFRKGLDIQYISDIISFINKNHNDTRSKKKSSIIFFLLKNSEVHLSGIWQYGVTRQEKKQGVAKVIERLIKMKWLYIKNGHLVKPCEISRFELDTSIYGEVDKNSNIYDILGFQKTEQDETDELVSDFKSRYSEDEILIILQQLSSIVKEDDGEFDPTVPKEEPFPLEPIRDQSHLDKISKNIHNIYNKADNVKYEQLLRRIRTSRSKDREHIGYRYHGHCQMCKTISSYWEITEISLNPKKELEQMNLSLCPTCAAQYRRLRHDENIMREFKHNILNADINGKPVVNIGDSQIHFTATHLAEIQELLRLQQEEL